LLIRAGFCILVVNNQRWAAKVLLTVPELELIHHRMCQEFVLAAVITEVYYCPRETQPPCICRKPAPGMLLAEAHADEIDLATRWMIGDSDIDMEAGRNAGC
jgi:D-glycero-D-manno-heptose 1,7-bisphosphate phosphatase